jgi:hypothetical protein
MVVVMVVVVRSVVVVVVAPVSNHTSRMCSLTLIPLAVCCKSYGCF